MIVVLTFDYSVATLLQYSALLGFCCGFDCFLISYEKKGICESVTTKLSDVRRFPC